MTPMFGLGLLCSFMAGLVPAMLYKFNLLSKNLTDIGLLGLFVFGCWLLGSSFVYYGWESPSHWWIVEYFWIVATGIAFLGIAIPFALKQILEGVMWFLKPIAKWTFLIVLGCGAFYLIALGNQDADPETQELIAKTLGQAFLVGFLIVVALYVWKSPNKKKAASEKKKEEHH